MVTVILVLLGWCGCSVFLAALWALFREPAKRAHRRRMEAFYGNFSPTIVFSEVEENNIIKAKQFYGEPDGLQ